MLSRPLLFAPRVVAPLASAATSSAAADILKSPSLNLSNGFKGKHIISSSQFSKSNVESLLGFAKSLENMLTHSHGIDLLNHRIMHTLFFEPSTRTRLSFETSMLRMGGQVINLPSSASSHQKGETLADTIRTVDKYTDVIVMRHTQEGSAAEAAKYAKNPILNGGDGTGEHPTQALLDLYCIQRELGRLEGLTITFVGDLKNGRTVHSLSKLASLFNMNINFISPQSLKMPAYLIQELSQSKSEINQYEQHQLAQVLSKSDVVYVTRVQKERFTDLNEYESVKDAFIITKDSMKQLKNSSILMHPLPRVNEIHTDVDADPRAAYFRQAQCGLYVRMALVGAVLGKM